MTLRCLSSVAPSCLRRMSHSYLLFSPLFSLALLIAVSTTNLLAQGGSATLTGQITDPKGAVVPEAAVEAVNIDTNVVYPTKTNGDGIYAIPSLPPGRYRIHFLRDGFKEVNMTDLVLHTQDTLQQNFALEVGSTSESVTVTAVGTTNDSPAVSLVVNRDFIEDMPLNGRSLADLLALAPGASPALGGSYSVDGQRPDANNFTVDGASATTGGEVNNGGQLLSSGLSGSVPSRTALSTTQNMVGLDALQEFKIQTSAYTAEYGRYPGGQIEFTTRSGTDSLHGSLFDYLRNTVLDANSWSNDVNHLPKGAEHQNDFGGTLGGPLLLPHVYDGRAKTFYFVSYEGLRLLIPSSGLYSIPSDAFRAWASPNVQPFLASFPDPAKSPGYTPTVDSCQGTLPNPADECDGMIPYSYSSPNNLDAMSFRADHTLSSRWKLFVRYADTPSSQTNNLTYEPLTLSSGSHIWTVGSTLNVSRNIISETRFNFNHESEYNQEYLAPWQGSVPFSRSLAVSSPFVSNPFSSVDLYVGPPGLSINSNLEYNSYASVQRQFQLVESLSWTKNAHAFKFGLDWRRVLDQYDAEPYYSALELTSFSDIHQGNASVLLVYGDSPSYPIFNNLSIYAQDHWTLGSRLTLDYGIRWEFNPPPGVSQGYFPLAVDQVNNVATTQALPWGSPLYKTQYLKFAPRLGFAYRLDRSSNHALVLRGGGGIYFDTGQQIAGGAFISGYPYTAQGPTLSGVPLPLSQSALMAPTVTLTPPYGPIYNFTDPNLTLPYTEQWSLSLDRTMNAHNVLTVSYVGNGGRKLLYNPQAGGSGSGLNPAIFTGGTASIESNGAGSAYNALQVTDTGNIVRGLQLVGSYTWSHAIDDLSSDTAYWTLERGNSDYDLPQMLNVALNYHLPLGTGGFLRSLRSGWLLSTRFVAQGGLPIDIYQTRTYSPQLHTYTRYRPNIVSGQPIYLHGSAAGAVPRQWRLNRAAFACAAGTTTLSTGACSGTPTAEGTLDRNYVRDPTFNNFNFSAQREFPIHERVSISFRVDAFNIFNHINVYNPATFTFANSQFGILNSAQGIGTSNTLYQTGAARSLQLNLHLQF